MSTLLADIDDGLGKTPYQTYTLTIGLDHLEVHVPFKHADAFERALKEDTSPRAKRLTVVKELVSKLDGMIMEG
jgi:hypothetical protein